MGSVTFKAEYGEAEDELPDFEAEDSAAASPEPKPAAAAPKAKAGPAAPGAKPAGPQKNRDADFDMGWLEDAEEAPETEDVAPPRIPRRPKAKLRATARWATPPSGRPRGALRPAPVAATNHRPIVAISKGRPNPPLRPMRKAKISTTSFAACPSPKPAGRKTGRPDPLAIGPREIRGAAVQEEVPAGHPRGRKDPDYPAVATPQTAARPTELHSGRRLHRDSRRR